MRFPLEFLSSFESSLFLLLACLPVVVLCVFVLFSVLSPLYTAALHPLLEAISSLDCFCAWISVYCWLFLGQLKSYSESTCPYPCVEVVSSPLFGSSRVSGLTWRASVYFMFMFIKGVRSGSAFVLRCTDVQFCQYYLFKRLLSNILVKNEVAVAVYIYIRVFCSSLLIYVCVFVLVQRRRHLLP